MDARAVVASAELVLVDFDGPLARLLPGERWLELSAQVRTRAGELGGPELEQALEGQPDHVQCLRTAAGLAPELGLPLADLVTRAELAAACDIAPGPDAVVFLEQCLERSAVAVITNNDPRVVGLVLDRDRPGLTDRLAAVLGRVDDRLDDLKPSPAMLFQALRTTGTQAGAAVFLGDSVTDVEAGRAAGVQVVGVAVEADRRQELLDAGAVAVVPSVADLVRTDEPGGR
jgi:HAD superfamily hydrolase (TIGR01509 family)